MAGGGRGSREGLCFLLIDLFKMEEIMSFFFTDGNHPIDKKKLVQDREERDLGRKSLTRSGGLGQGKMGELALSRNASNSFTVADEKVEDTESQARGRVDLTVEAGRNSLLRVSVFSVQWGERSSGWGGGAGV